MEAGWRGAKVGKMGDTCNTVNNKKNIKRTEKFNAFEQTDTNMRSIVYSCVTVKTIHYKMKEEFSEHYRGSVVQ